MFNEFGFHLHPIIIRHIICPECGKEFKGHDVPEILEESDGNKMLKCNKCGHKDKPNNYLHDTLEGYYN
jgi:uncharacterized C2H2 Zn-finger protein